MRTLLFPAYIWLDFGECHLHRKQVTSYCKSQFYHPLLYKGAVFNSGISKSRDSSD